MARRVFFSFHYERDKWRASVVRNSWVTKPDREAAGFWDAAAWEEVKKQGEEAIKRWINRQLEGTSVTAVLIGAETARREYVQYEIIKSHEERKGLLGVYIHNIKDQDGDADSRGENPFDNIYVEEDGKKVYFPEIYPTYDWVYAKGYDNLGSWIEKAANEAGR